MSDVKEKEVEEEKEKGKEEVEEEVTRTRVENHGRVKGYLRGDPSEYVYSLCTPRRRAVSRERDLRYLRETFEKS